jgi:hypothetical protein
MEQGLLILPPFTWPMLINRFSNYIEFQFSSLFHFSHIWGNIMVDIVEIERGSVDWTQLTQGRDQWRDFVNTGLNLQVP